MLGETSLSSMVLICQLVFLFLFLFLLQGDAVSN